MATLIKTDGTETPLENTGLETLQKAVGGYIQIVPTVDGRLLVLDEEGKLKGKEINPKANALYGDPYDVVVGDCVVATNSEIK